MELPKLVEENCEEEEMPTEKDYYNQYSVEAGNVYRPTATTVKKLSAGLYDVGEDNRGIYFEKITLNIGDLIRFPNSVSDKIIGEFSSFWEKYPAYHERGEPHKRGFLLWGPPGGGKTCVVSFIADDFIKAGNIVINFNYVTRNGLLKFRRIEPDRRVMVIIEDIDSFASHEEGEQDLLRFLDGTVQYKNTIIIATTNYPEHLPDRIINRPSRFDRISFINNPSEEERRLYLEQKAKTLTSKKLKKWVKDTEDWTFAHLKELILSVEVYDLSYEETLRRLNKMRKKLEHSGKYEKKLHGRQGIGFSYEKKGKDEEKEEYGW